MSNPIRLAYQAYRNALRNPKYRWWVIGGTLLWLVNPLNAIPVVGEIDDALVITIFAAEVSQMAIEGLRKKKQQAQENAQETTTIPTELVQLVD